MADYIYLLETRLSKAQRSALDLVRDVARAKAVTVFLVGGAVRDLTSGSPVRDLDLVVQGNALRLRKDLENAGAAVAGESEAGQALYLTFAGGVRMEVGSTLSATYPKPGKPVLQPANLLDDLRRRDFTANAMALSLNEGSYGLLMDPTNGVADIENRELRLVSNYGFIEDPVRMTRAARLMARLGWTMEDKTQTRYETGKSEDYIAALAPFPRGYETEEIFHEEDPLRVMRRLEEEGWMQHLYPGLTVAKANVPEMERLRETQTQLQMQGVHADAAVANFPLLTAKLSAGELAELKKSFPRQGFVAQIESLDAEAKEFASQILSKSAALPSQAFQLIHAAKPEVVLWVAHTSKSGALQGKLKSFYTDWPQARQKVPYALMQEMRIIPELPQYEELVEKIFFALMDGGLGTTEEMRAFLEPYSPPAPPPTVHLRRPRASKKDAKGGKGRKKAAANLDRDEEDEDNRDLDIDPDDVDLGNSDDAEDDEAPRVDLADDADDLEDVTEAEDDDLDEIAPVKAAPARKAAASVAPLIPPPSAPATEPKEKTSKEEKGKLAAEFSDKPASKAAAPAQANAMMIPEKKGSEPRGTPAKKSVLLPPAKASVVQAVSKSETKSVLPKPSATTSVPPKKAVPAKDQVVVVKSPAKKMPAKVAVAAKKSNAKVTPPSKTVKPKGR